MALSCPQQSAIPISRSESFGLCDRMPPPIDMSWRAPDPDIPLAVHSLSPRARHWAIFWDVPYQDRNIRANRILHVVADRGKKLYVNWGPLTKFVSDDDRRSSRELVLGVVDLTRRRQLEVVATHTPVCSGDQEWNGQDWVKAVLREAVLLGLLSKDSVASVLVAAQAF
ncbi:hypothetical protein GLOTRDRAFT_93700 [Gloeophyllum trabeum ATCC 11539]|uniref:Uncharacterized protein n=1 Tax=Gloeophyllum trabeum (strain ATCC 11539 / FP-39264 / Madison 617) TaxID=670483 RepID=S7RQK3_GLOTA|nr:uncharacterized protein GLOTRDRAFT_93700 [Gloeophyllum trabeum ATCC 11539]EPQ55179.1 hypothetical protein GLOTRDRAFT_93700 [Gloeophyllum trabeum ATCC 11539]